MSSLKESRVTPEDFAALKGMFAGKDDNLKVLRKMFYPEKEAGNPIGINFDLWSKLDLTGLDNEQMLVTVKANQMLTAHIESCLAMIKQLAGREDETPEQTQKRLLADSAR